MRPTPKQSTRGGGLRQQAEARLRQARGKPGAAPSNLAVLSDPHRLLHELQVHQVELQLQNSELLAARNDLETALDQFTDLYEFAPVGYFSLDQQGRILKANLTGAALLKVERSGLAGQRWLRFVAPASQQACQGFLEKVFAAPDKQVCEVALLNAEGKTIWADLQAVPALSPDGSSQGCRLVVSDISALKRAEEAQSRIGVLAAMNEELQREIVRRREVEEALRHSERHQGHLLEQALQLQEQLRHLSHQILRAQEEERKRISRELHDEIAQTLMGINVHLENLAREAAGNPEGLRRRIAQTQRLVEKSVDIVHQFARELRPAVLDDLGLVASIRSFLKDFTKRTRLRVRFKAFAGVEQLNGVRRTVLYRVVQSALANVAQHAQATRVAVSIQKMPDAVCLEIKDNGVSFKVDQVLQAKKGKSLGLLGMRERAEMVGGAFGVESIPGRGTTIQVQIPCGRVADREGEERSTAPEIIKL